MIPVRLTMIAKNHRLNINLVLEKRLFERGLINLFSMKELLGEVVLFFCFELGNTESNAGTKKIAIKQATKVPKAVNRPKSTIMSR